MSIIKELTQKQAKQLTARNWDKVNSIIITELYRLALERLPGNVGGPMICDPKFHDKAIQAYQDDTRFYMQCQRLAALIISELA